MTYTVSSGMLHSSIPYHAKDKNVNKNVSPVMQCMYCHILLLFVVHFCCSVQI